MNRQWKFVITTTLYAVGLRQAWAEAPQFVTLDVGWENWVNYIGNVADPSQLASSPNAVSATLRNLMSQVGIADIVSVNGKPAKGVWINSGRTLNIAPTPAAGQGIGDVVRSGIVDVHFEILQADRTPIGSIMTAAFSLLQGGVADVFDREGHLLKRFAANSSAGPLEEPWAFLLAPEDFGRFGGALLIGNLGDGRINAYNRETGQFLGQLQDDHRNPISSGAGLWSLSFGNGWGEGESAKPRLFFTSGVNNEIDGLFDIAGTYVDTGGNVHGFLLGQGAFTPIDFPGAPFYRQIARAMWLARQETFRSTAEGVSIRPWVLLGR